MELTYHAQSRPDVFDWQATGGSLSVDADGVSGTVDASLAREGGKVPVQVKGSWRCGEVTPLAVCVTMTIAFGTTAFCTSVMVP